MERVRFAGWGRVDFRGSRDRERRTRRPIGWLRGIDEIA
jgi:hypothetical protein